MLFEIFRDYTNPYLPVAPSAIDASGQVAGITSLLLYALAARNCNQIVSVLHVAHVKQVDHGFSLSYVFYKVFIVFLSCVL